MIQYQRLGDALVARGLLTRESVQQALQTQFQSGLRLGEVLIGMGLIQEHDLTNCLANQYGFDIVDLATIVPQSEALKLVTPGFALAHLILPLYVTDTELRCAIADPLDLIATDTTAQATQRRITVVLSGPTQLFNAIQKSYGLGECLDREIPQFSLHLSPAPIMKSVRRRDTQDDRRALLALFNPELPTAVQLAA